MQHLRPLLAQARCNHTATHLLQAALKQVVGGDISQAGSLVDFERLRFDFNAPEAPSPAQLARVEKLVTGTCTRHSLRQWRLTRHTADTEWIGDSVELETSSMGIKEARASGAVAMFGEKYGDVVRVVNVPGVSMELCGGTHVANTSEIGGFKVRASTVPSRPRADRIRHRRSSRSPALLPACAASRRWPGLACMTCCRSGRRL